MNAVGAAAVRSVNVSLTPEASALYAASTPGSALLYVAVSPATADLPDAPRSVMLTAELPLPTTTGSPSDAGKCVRARTAFTTYPPAASGTRPVSTFCHAPDVSRKFTGVDHTVVVKPVSCWNVRVDAVRNEGTSPSTATGAVR